MYGSDVLFNDYSQIIFCTITNRNNRVEPTRPSSLNGPCYSYFELWPYSYSYHKTCAWQGVGLEIEENSTRRSRWSDDEDSDNEPNCQMTKSLLFVIRKHTLQYSSKSSRTNSTLVISISSIRSLVLCLLFCVFWCYWRRILHDQRETRDQETPGLT